MVTAKIKIKGYLAEYLIGKYYDEDLKCVCLPSDEYLYHTIWNLTQKRPENCPLDDKNSNLTLRLPDRRVGKDPSYYNYLGERSIKIIEERVRHSLYAELFQTLDSNKFEFGTEFQDTVYEFKLKYKIESISDDAFLKSFYRWREIKRQKMVRRKYRKTK